MGAVSKSQESCHLGFAINQENSDASNNDTGIHFHITRVGLDWRSGHAKEKTGEGSGHEAASETRNRKQTFVTPGLHWLDAMGRAKPKLYLGLEGLGQFLAGRRSSQAVDPRSR